MGFSPFHFQAPLAAGGVALMAYNWLHSTVPHGEGPFRLADISWGALSAMQIALYGPLVAIVIVMAAAHVLLSLAYAGGLVRWRADERGYREFVDGPVAGATGAFVPTASGAMTVAVALAVLPFVVPETVASRTLISVGSVAFLGLLATALALEAGMLGRLFGRPFDTSGLSFVWLVDAFAFGLLALAGTGLAAAADSRMLASVTAIGSVIALVVGSVLLASKLGVLVGAQVRSGALPDTKIQPAFFLLVPITCLYGVSYHRILLHVQGWFGVEVALPSYFLITFSWAAAIAWGAFVVYLIRDYFRSYFRTSEYFPAQWAMV